MRQGRLAGRRSNWPRKWRPLRAARWPPSTSPRARSRCPTSPSRTPPASRSPLQNWRGRTVLLNLWATWCVPCRKEMPALDALQQRLGGPDFEVVAVNIDTRDPDKPKAFLKEVGITKLAYYADPTAKTFQDLEGDRPRLRHADHLAARPARLRDRHHRRPRRMGERRRGQADPGGARQELAPEPLAGSHHALILTFCPTPAATLARLWIFC